MIRTKKRLFVVVMLGLVIAAAGAAWVNRAPLLAWYYLRELAAASEAERDGWVERVVGLDAAAAPGLLDLLEREDGQASANAETALHRLGERWGADNVRTAELAEQLAQRFEHSP